VNPGTTSKVCQSLPDVKWRFVTAMAKGEPHHWTSMGGDAQKGPLTVMFDGPRIDVTYDPMRKQGAILLGNGGDNSVGSQGTFYEGVMTAGYPTDAADNAVQANIVSVGYSGQTNVPNGPAGTITNSGQCVDVGADDTGVDGAAVQLWNCQTYAEDQHWTHYADGSLRTLSRCLDINGNGTANGTQVELWDCNGVGGQKWVQRADGSVFNPQSGRCLDDPSGNTANGTRLQIWDCNGSAAQKFSVSGGAPVNAPGGKCVDVIGDDSGANGTMINLWDCQSFSVDQHWVQRGNGTLGSLGRCLDIVGNGTANGTAVQLWDCDGAGGQNWVQQGNGSLLNPQSGRCLDDPSGNTADGTRLQIWDCNGSAAQVFTLN